MQIAVIGTGRMGRGLVRTLTPFLKNLMWASRTPEKVNTLIQENNFKNVASATMEEALNADVIIPSLWFKDLLPWAVTNKEKLRGKIVIDLTNPFTEDFSDFTLNWGESASEELEKVIPESLIVGAFKTTFFQVFDHPIHEGKPSDVYVTSDHEEAKKEVIALFQPLPFRLLDGGGLKNNRTIERMTLFERELSIRYGTYPYVAFRLFGLES